MMEKLCEEFDLSPICETETTYTRRSWQFIHFNLTIGFSLASGLTFFFPSVPIERIEFFLLLLCIHVLSDHTNSLVTPNECFYVQMI